jgi:GNAT superfamily N-acetyltransferase
VKTARLQLIPVFEKEIRSLHRLSLETFKETFEAENKKEDLLAYLKQKMSIRQLKKELNIPFSSFFFVTYKKQMTGYLKLNFDNAHTENILNNQAFEIERIYLLKEYQNKGLGTELFEAAIQIGK